MILPSLFPSGKDFKSDFLASISVFLVAIPLCLGIAHASGAPQSSGIVAGIVGGIIVGILSGSRFSVSGPAAGLTAVVLLGIREMDSFEVLLLSVLLAGIFQILFGILHAGVLSSYIPTSIIKGLMGAIGIILILKQFPHVIGYDVEQFGVEEFDLNPNDLEDNTNSGEKNTLTIFFHSFQHIHRGILILGSLSLFILIFWEKKISRHVPGIPGFLVTVLLATFTSILLKEYYPDFQFTSDHFVNLPIYSSPSDFFSTSHFPDYSQWNNPLVWKYGGLIAIIASIESLLCIEVVDRLDPQRQSTPINKELIAQGFGNFFSGLFGGLPVTSVIVRGSVNINSGAKTKLSTILHGIFILLSIIFFSNFLNYIPLASLAAILCYTGYKLASPGILKDMYHRGQDHFLPYTVTLLGVIFTDILFGTIIGGLVAVFFILRDVFYSPVIKVLSTKNLTKVFFGENVSFLHKARIKETLNSIDENTTIILDCRKSKYIHRDILDLLERFREEAHFKHVHVEFMGIPHLEKTTDKVIPEKWKSYDKLMEDNKDWVWEQTQEDPLYFEKIAKTQEPEFFVIGCADSRVPLNLITKSKPGTLFVHRNISNLIHTDDVSLMSAIEFAIKVLGVKHIVVCGHYKCGGVKAALEDFSDGSIKEWIAPIKELIRSKKEDLDTIPTLNEKVDQLVEWNVEEQIKKLKSLPVIQESIEKTGLPYLHGWVYDLKSGVLLETISPPKEHD